jgi:hypothetical protein
MTSWIPGFGGGKSKEEKQAEEAKQWHESHLGTGDEFFTHSRSAVDDTGSFKVSDVRPRPKEADRGGSRLVRVAKGKYEKPPQVSHDHITSISCLNELRAAMNGLADFTQLSR